MRWRLALDCIIGCLLLVVNLLLNLCDIDNRGDDDEITLRWVIRSVFIVLAGSAVRPIQGVPKNDPTYFCQNFISSNLHQI